MSNAAIELPSEEDFIRGWKDFCAALGDVSEDTAQRYAKRSKDPLPVYWDHKGPFMHKGALREWILRQRLPYTVHLRVRESAGERGE